MSNVTQIHDKAEDLPLRKVMELVARKVGNDFAQSLCSQYKRRGSLSERQLPYAYKMAQEVMDAGRGVRDPRAPRADLPNLSAAYAALMEHEIRVARILFDGDTVQLKKAARKGVFYTVLVSEDRYLGALPEDGSFRPAKGVSDVDLPKLCRTLADFAADPKDAMVRYGHATGVCGCCGRELTDPESVRIGIGPICLKKYFGG